MLARKLHPRHAMIAAAMLNLIEEAGEGVMVLADGLHESELARSRITKAEIVRQLVLIAGLLQGLAPEVRAAMPEIDWDAWRAVERDLSRERISPAKEDALWFDITSLVPATLSWLRLYRRTQPELFSFTI